MDKIESLIERNDALIRKMEERDAVYARALQMKQKAEVPDEELQKIRETIANTKCDLPDTTEMERKVTTSVTGGIRSTVTEEIREAIRNEYVPGKCVETLNTKVIVYRAICALVVLLFIGTLLWYRNSEHFWGSQYLSIVQSRYTTDDEKKALWEDVYAIDALPRGFKTNPAYVKAKIRQNKTVLKDRKKEAKANKGKWSTRAPIER